MNWDAIGAVGEILGALAVVVTLFYLARQLRENTASNRVATAWSMMNSFNVSHGEIFSSEETAQFAARLYAQDENMGLTDQARCNSLVLRHLNGLVAAYDAYAAGQLSEMIWVRVKRDAAFLLMPGLRPFLVAQLKLVDPAITLEIFGAELAAEVEATPLPPQFQRVFESG